VVAAVAFDNLRETVSTSGPTARPRRASAGVLRLRRRHRMGWALTTGTAVRSMSARAVR